MIISSLGSRLYKISCSSQLSMKIFLIYVKMPIMPTIVGITTYVSKKNSILGVSKHENAEFVDICKNYEHLKFHAQPS